MKLMAAITLGLYTTVSLANCNVYVPVKEFNYAGLTINFSFYSLFKEKGMTEVANIGEADYELKLSDEEVIGRNFHKAKVNFDFIDLRGQKTVLEITNEKTCFTQYCGISDYKSVWIKSYKKLNKQLPVCR